MNGQPLNELRLNLIGKLFFATCAAWLVGKATHMKLRGTKEEIDAVTNAMVSSKRFQDELNKSGASVSSVMDKLNLKHATAKDFERILGIPWPLIIPLLIAIDHVAVNIFSAVAT